MLCSRLLRTSRLAQPWRAPLLNASTPSSSSLATRSGRRARSMPARAASSSALAAGLQGALAAAADEAVRAGQDAYFKGTIKHRGVKTPAVEAVAKSFLAQHPQLDQQQLRALSVVLLQEPLQEDKLAGIMLRQRCLSGAAAGSSSSSRSSGSHTWRQELADLRALYTAGHVFAWSTCDSICGRLLGPLMKQLLKGPAPAEGQACARAVMGWCREEDLWLRRSSVVAFVTLARLPDGQVFPGFRAALLDTLAVTVRGQERFAQTGTGWVLREVGKGNADQLLQFVEANLRHFSAEGLRYALEKQPTAVRRRLLAAHKAAAAQAGSSGGGGGGGAAADDSQQQPKPRRRRG